MAKPRMSQSNSDDAKGFQTAVSGGTTYIGENINIYGESAPAIAQQSNLPDVTPYFQGLCENYQHWQTLYTPTDVEGKQKLQEKLDNQPGQWDSPFSFELMVQTLRQEEKKPGTDEQKEKVERFSVLEGIRKYAAEHVMLVGRPGSGKSTALARLVLEEATEQRTIPVLVELRSWQGSIELLIRNALKRHGLTLTDDQLEGLWQDDRLLLLFDGLNELPSESARSQLTVFRQNHPKIPMIFTTRDLRIGGDFSIKERLEMQPLTEPQIQDFVRSYIPDLAEQMLRQLKDRLRELGQTPLLLWMLCEVMRQLGSELPTNLGGVFRVFTQTYERSSIRNHEVAALKGDVQPLSDRRLWFKAMKHLAFSMMQGETPVDFRVVISRNEAEQALETLFEKESSPPEMARNCLDDLLNHHLLQPDTTDKIEFRHQLIQEYYAAEALLERLPGLSDAALQREYLNYLKWTEPVALMLALVEDERLALRVVRSGLEMDLRLGARLAGKVIGDFQKITVGWIEDLLIPELSKVELLSSTNSIEALPRLLKTAQSPDYSIRWASATALGKINTPDSVQALSIASKDSSPFVCLAAVAALGNLGNDEAIKTLLEVLENAADYGDIYLRSAYEVGRLGNKIGIQCLREALNHPQSSVTRKAIAALHLLNTEFSNSVLLEALQHPKTYVRELAVLCIRKNC